MRRPLRRTSHCSISCLAVVRMAKLRQRPKLSHRARKERPHRIASRHPFAAEKKVSHHEWHQICGKMSANSVSQFISKAFLQPMYGTWQACACASSICFVAAAKAQAMNRGNTRVPCKHRIERVFDTRGYRVLVWANGWQTWLLGTNVEPCFFATKQSFNPSTAPVRLAKSQMDPRVVAS